MKISDESQVNWAFWIAAQARCGVPVAFGVPGTGKTAICRAAAKAMKREYIQFLLSTMLPEDLNGIPMPSSITIEGETHQCVRNIHSEIYLKARFGKSFVHLDEVNHASPPLQAAAQENWFNNPPKEAIVVATANPPEMATDGFEFSAPVVNRLCLLDWESESDVWLNGMDGEEFPEPSIPLLPTDWSGYAAKWRSIIALYARQNCSEFDTEANFPKKSKDQCKPWRSQRSWYNMAMNLGACEAVGGTVDTAKKLCEGFIGDAATYTFFDWYDKRDLPTAEDLYNDPDKLEMPSRFDLALSIVKSVGSYTKEQIVVSGDSGSAWEQGIDFLEKVYEENHEIGKSIAPSFVKLKPADHMPTKREGDLWKSIKAEREKAAS